MLRLCGQVSLLRRGGQPGLHAGRLAPALRREARRPRPQRRHRARGLQGRLHHHSGILKL